MDEDDIKFFEPIYKGVPPFMKYGGGFGYLGVLLEHKNTGKIQCHLCGKLFNNVGLHLSGSHNGVSPQQYREMVGLNITTPLVSQRTSNKLRNNFLDLTPEKAQKVIKRLKNNNVNIHKNNLYKKRERKGSFQILNKFGTCPEQVKDLFVKEYTRLGRIPKISELSDKLRYVVDTRFGSYKKALIVWGVSESDYRTHITNSKLNAISAREEMDFFPKYEAEDVKKKYGEFFYENKRMPTWDEVKKYGFPGRVPFKRAFGMDKSGVERLLKVGNTNY